MKDNEIKIWNNYKIELKEEELLSYIDVELKKIIEWFSNYYSQVDVVNKFINKGNAELLISNLKNIKVVSFFKPQGSDVDRSWGYIYTNNLYTVFLNVYNFFNGRINASISDTIIHEIGHLIDFQLRRMGERPSYLESSVLNSSKNDEYIISREEDYARVQRLRVILELSPLADVNELKEGLDKLIKDKKIILEQFNLELTNDSLIASYSSPIRNLTLSELSGVFGNIIVNDYLASDIGYLFAKYSKVNNGKIELDLKKIARINQLFVNNDNGFGNFG